MAQSFWNKRKDSMQTASGYIKATDSVSRPTALIMTILGIFIVGGALFGVFAGTRWAYSKLSNTSTTATTTKKPASTTKDTKSVTATSSTSTTTPSSTTTTTAAPAASATTATTVVATAPVKQPATTNLPNTGPGSYLGVFIAIAIIGLLGYRRSAIKN